jgi:hypothetical protein
VKHHLRRAFHTHMLTFEEFSTALAEIEVCLNSRPLCPLGSDPEDLNVLTPAHYLIGMSSGIVPDSESLQTRTDHLGRFQLLQRIRNQFEERRKWSSEYLQHLQERGKWRVTTDNVRIGQLVLLR